MKHVYQMAPFTKKIMVALLAIAMLVTSITFSSSSKAMAATTIGSAQDYMVTAEDTSADTCKITFKPTNYASYAIIHYKVNNGEQVNVGMAASGANFEYNVTGIKSGDKIDCSFTYNKGGLQYDSSPMTYITGSSAPANANIEAPFGLVATSPSDGTIGIVWGRGTIDNYNIYIDGTRVANNVTCGYYTYSGYAAGMHTVEVTTVSGSNESVKTSVTVNVNGTAATTPAPTTTTTQAPTTTTQAIVDNDIAAPFGLVVGCPSNNTISVVWGRGEIDSYNVYIDGTKVANGVGCGYYTYSGYAAGNHTVSVTTVSGGKESAKTTLTVNVTGSATTPTTPAPVTPTTQAPTTTQAATTTPVTTMATDTSIEQPFGMVVSCPDDNQIAVVWGKGSINSYNVYINGRQVANKVACGYYTYRGYVAGTYTVALATVSNGKESKRVEMQVTVFGATEIATTEAATTTPLSQYEVPQIRNDIAPNDEKMFLQLNNKTNGQYSDDEVYWCILGKNENHELSYLDINGNLIKASTSMNTVPKGDRMCAPIWHKLSDADYVYLPDIESGRMYLSYGSPVYITFNTDGDGNIGYAGPDLNNTSDPNADVLFEFLEFTVTDKEYWGNTTRVDFFSFPMVTRLVGSGGYNNYPGDSDVYDKVVGDLGTRAEIFEAFRNEVPTEFKTLVGDLRIMAPCKTTFNEGQIYANYLDSYINEFWTKYASQDLVFRCDAGKFTGRVYGDHMVFTKSGDSGTYTVYKPTTQDVLEGKGNFNRGNSTELVIEAQLCAALNRGIATDPANYGNPSAYYKNAKANYYSAFWHRHSINALAYGFCYDDVFDQSTLLHYTNPTALVIDLRW